MQTKNIYSLPIDRSRVTEVNSNSIAHVGDMVYAIDFDAPLGTPIVAACEGRVIAVKDDSNSGGVDQQFEVHGNYIEIVHANDEVSEYEHLAYQSARVKVGDDVVRGQHIASVGNTGWSECPHLHFMVYPKGQEYKTLTIRFREDASSSMSAFRG